MAKRTLVPEKVITRTLNERNYNREREKYEICTQKDVVFKDLPLFYEIEAVSFDAETRAAAITFVASRVSGMTSYPYATSSEGRRFLKEFNETTKRELRAITLTNEALENLQRHPDELISKFAIDIICTIKDSEIYPSWFVEELATQAMDFEIDKASKSIYLQEHTLKKATEEINAKIKEKEEYIKKADELIASSKKDLEMSEELQRNMLADPKKYFRIFAKSRAASKVAELKKQADELRAAIKGLEQHRADAEKAIYLLREDLQAVADSCEQICASEREKMEKAKAKYFRVMEKIAPLPY